MTTDADSVAPAPVVLDASVVVAMVARGGELGYVALAELTSATLVTCNARVQSTPGATASVEVCA